MTTLRNDPTTSPIARQTKGNTAGWATALRVSLIRARGAPLYRLADLEYRQVHRDDHAADDHPEHDHDHRLHEAGERFHRVVDLGLEEVCDLAEHGVERARLLADRHHLDDHVGEEIRFLHGSGEAVAGAHLLLDFPGALLIDVVPGRAADRVERFHQGNARGEHGGQRARPARDRRFPYQVAEDGYLERPAVHEDLDRDGALPQLEKSPYAAHHRREDDVPVLDEEIRDAHDEQRGRGQVGAEVGE